MTEWCTTRSMAAAVAMGLAKMRSHSEEPGFVVFGDEREEHLRLCDTPYCLWQPGAAAPGGRSVRIAPSVRPPPAGVPWRRGTFLPEPGRPKALTVDSSVDGAVLGQLAHLLLQRQGRPVVIEGLPGLP